MDPTQAKPASAAPGAPDMFPHERADPLAAADSGLGVPPRPTPVPPVPGATFKEPLMARPPFPAPNAPLSATTGISQGSGAGGGAGSGAGGSQSGAASGASFSPSPSLSGFGAGANPPMPASARPAGPPGPVPARPSALQAEPERRTLVVGRGISVQGSVQDAERLVVEGTVEANMIHAAELAVSLGGMFRGEVEVESAEIAGTIDGTVTARANLIVRATGVVLGTARCRRLQVEDGGQITGRIEMLSEAKAEG